METPEMEGTNIILGASTKGRFLERFARDLEIFENANLNPLDYAFDLLMKF